MRPTIVIIIQVVLQNAFQVLLGQDDHMVQTFATDGTDNSLHVGILPWRSTSRDSLFDAHVLDSVLKIMAVDQISIPNQKPRRCVIWKRLDDLLSRPLGSWILGDVEVHHAPTMMAQHDKRVQDAERRRRHREEINADRIRHVILDKGLPGL